MAKKHAQLHEDMEALASQSKMMMKEKTVLQRAHSASLLAQSQLKEELRALQHLMAAREAQRVREASERDALLAAGSQRIAEQDAALAVLRQRVATLRTELKLASEAEHARLLAGVQENTLLRESNLQLREQERRAAQSARHYWR